MQNMTKYKQYFKILNYSESMVLLNIKYSLEECEDLVFDIKKDCIWDVWYKSTDLWYGILASVRISIKVFMLYSS